MGKVTTTPKITNTMADCIHKHIQYIVYANGYGCEDCGIFVSASEMASYPNQLTDTKTLFTTIVHNKFMQKTKEASDPESWLKPKYEHPLTKKKKKKISQIKAKKKLDKIVPGSMAFHAASPLIINDLISRLKSKAWVKVKALDLLEVVEPVLVTRIVDLQLGMIEHLGMSVNQVTNPKSMALAQQNSGVSDKILTLMSNAVKANNKHKKVKPMEYTVKPMEPCHYDYHDTVTASTLTVEGMGTPIKLMTTTDWGKSMKGILGEDND